MRHVTALERRTRLVRRHRLDGSATDPHDVVRSMLALHATDPASVYLSVLARSSSSRVGDVTAALYDHRSVVRWMAMRRTVFVLDRQDLPMVHAAVSTALAATLRRQLLARIERNGIDPAMTGDLAERLAEIESDVERRVERDGALTGVRLRELEPALRATIRARTRSETPQALTSPLLTVMSTEGRLVRGDPVGTWTTRNHLWDATENWLPGGVPQMDRVAAQTRLAGRWLEVFGPATLDDLQWWTGWNKTITRAAVSALDVERVDLHGRQGIDLAQRPEDSSDAEPTAALLPALDPTPMGWKHRAWFTAVDPALLYDAAGNIGPTLWWDGEIVGSWSSTARGIRLAMIIDRGREAIAALELAASQLEHRLDGAVVTPAARTPLEVQLTTRAAPTRRAPP